MAPGEERFGESSFEREGDRQIFESRDHDAGVVKRSTWKGVIWDTFDLPPKERKLLFKVDAVILTLASVSEGATRDGAPLMVAGVLYQESGPAKHQLGCVYPTRHARMRDESLMLQFLSGMKEDLGMYQNQLVTAVSIWTVGYVVGQIPSNLLLTRVDPRWVIPAVSGIGMNSRKSSRQLELGWGIATLGSYGVKSYKALYALRFLVGLFE
jgi:hypothetical protein